MEQGVKHFGLGLFITGFAIFLASFIIGNHRVAPSNIENVIPDENQRKLFNQHADGLFETTYSTPFGLMQELDPVFDKVNQTLQEKFGLTGQDIEKIIESQGNEYPLQFSLEQAGEVFREDTEEDQFKSGAVKDYAGWMDGKSYNDRETLKSDIESTAGNIAEYEILNTRGFDSYTIKDYKFSLARASTRGPIASHPWVFIFITYGFCILGALLFFLPKINEGPPGIKNNGVFRHSMKNGGWIGILTGTFLILFYIILYFFPEYMINWIIMVDPLSQLLNGGDAGRFFLYGYMYTLAILVMGARMMIHYRHSRYQIIRTISVMFFQLCFAFLIPEVLVRLNRPYFDFKNIWPLDYDFFFDSSLNTLIQSGTLGIFMLGWGIALIIIAVPVFTYFYGKRWYCSWVCGCGGLAETLGDPYRQLSDKSLKAWKIERWMVHGVLVFAVVMTAGVLYSYWTDQSEMLGINTYSFREIYGVWIGAGFAGVVGTGFYPLMGNRVWCRFGCPLAAYLGMIQRFKSRFRITTNGGQCISCGNCSTYCEMGIDVKWYAQRGQNIVRSSCVGCGICSAVCPRGVLKLENKEEKGRFGEPVLTGNESFKGIGEFDKAKG